MKKIIYIFLILFSFLQAKSQMQFDFNTNCQNIYNQISSLKINAASQNILEELKTKPTNAMPILLANYVDFYELFFNENPKELALRKDNESKRLDALDLGNKNSPYYLHSKAMIYFQWGLIKLKFRDFFSSAKDIRKAYLLFTENKKKFPTFTTGDAYLGSLQCAIGTIPNEYKWIISILGLKGNLKNGLTLVQQQLENNKNPFQQDALFFYVYINQYILNEPKQAWQELKKYKSKCKSNRLLTFMTANIAINQNKADEVMKVINENEDEKDFLNIPILNYEMGCAYLYKLDSKSINYLKNYTTQFKGKYYLKDAYYKIAMMYYINGDMANANQNLNEIIKQPNSETDADKLAQQFAKKKIFPNKELLKIRFLYDGGYFNKALTLAQNFNYTNETKLEYYYRKARIFDEINKNDSAINYYLQTIQLGKSETTYFASRASLQLAMLYENINKNKLAIQYYKLSMDMENTEYKNSIDMRAKAGLQRLGVE